MTRRKTAKAKKFNAKVEHAKETLSSLTRGGGQQLAGEPVALPLSSPENPPPSPSDPAAPGTPDQAAPQAQEEAPPAHESLQAEARRETVAPQVLAPQR